MANQPTHHITFHGEWKADISVEPLKLQAAKSGDRLERQAICSAVFAALVAEYDNEFTYKYSDAPWNFIDFKVIKPGELAVTGKHL